jgi:hypothetical protein
MQYSTQDVQNVVQSNKKEINLGNNQVVVYSLIG